MKEEAVAKVLRVLSPATQNALVQEDSPVQSDVRCRWLAFKRDCWRMGAKPSSSLTHLCSEREEKQLRLRDSCELSPDLSYSTCTSRRSVGLQPTMSVGVRKAIPGSVGRGDPLGMGPL
jgi:hypothetical protein